MKSISDHDEVVKLVNYEFGPFSVEEGTHVWVNDRTGPRILTSESVAEFVEILFPREVSYLGDLAHNWRGEPVRNAADWPGRRRAGPSA